MAQWVKSSPFEHGNLSSNPQIPHKAKHGSVWTQHSLGSREAETGESLEGSDQPVWHTPSKQ